MKKITSLILIVTIMLSNSVMLSRATESKPVAKPYRTIVQTKTPSPKPKKKVANHSNFKKFYLGLTAFSLAAIALLSKDSFFNKEKNTEKLTVAPENNFPKSESVNKTSDLTPPEKKTDEEVIVEKLQPLVKELTPLAGQTYQPSINSDHYVSSIFQRTFATFDPNVCTSIFEGIPDDISHQCIVPSNSSNYIDPFITDVPDNELNIEIDPENNNLNPQEDSYVDDEAEYNQPLPNNNQSTFWNILSKKISLLEATLITAGIYGACKLTKFIIDRICPRAKKLTEVAYQTALEKTLQTQSTQREATCPTVEKKVLQKLSPKKSALKISNPQTLLNVPAENLIKQISNSQEAFEIFAEPVKTEISEPEIFIVKEAVDIAGKAAEKLTLQMSDSQEAFEIFAEPVKTEISKPQTFSIATSAKEFVDMACQIEEKVIKTVTPTTPRKVVETSGSPTRPRSSSFNSPEKMLFKNSNNNFAALPKANQLSPNSLKEAKKKLEKKHEDGFMKSVLPSSPTRPRSNSNPRSPSRKTSSGLFNWVPNIFNWNDKS